MSSGQKLTVIAAVLILTLTSPAVFAQGDADTWEFSLAPYLWAVGLDGDITVKGTTMSTSTMVGVRVVLYLMSSKVGQSLA